MRKNVKCKIIGFSMIAILVAFDQWFKILAQSQLEQKGFIKFIDPFINFQWTTNTGAAWGSFEGNKLLLIGLTSAILIAVIVLIIINKIDDNFLIITSCVVVSGGLGNLIDRIFRGYVIDYLQFGFFSFPIFNFADICVTIGAITFGIYYLFFYKSDKNIVQTIPEQKG